MKPARHSFRVVRVLALAFCLGGGSAQADRLYLESGGFVDAEVWWIEGDNVLYESAGGTVGIPRAMVVRVERRESAASGPLPSANRIAPTPSPERQLDTARLRELADEGVEAFRAGDYETASSRFFGILQEQPDLHTIRAYYVASEMRLGHDGSALSAILDGLMREPEQPEFHELLGDLSYNEEQVEEALRSWRKAFALAPSDRLREKIVKGERDQQASAGFDFSRSSHFNMRFDGEVDQGLAADVRDYLEERYWRFADEYAHAPPQPITVLLYPNREFHEITQAPEWVGGLYDGKIRVPLGGLRHLTHRARRVLAHELTHAVVFSKTRGRCPRWLQEGLAQRSEGKSLTGVEQEKVAERLSTGDAAEWESSGFSYPMALSLTRYLEDRGGFGNLVYLLELLGQGSEIDEALTRVYGEGYADVCRSWAGNVSK